MEAIDKDVLDNNEYLSRMNKFYNGPWKSKAWSFRHRSLEANNNDGNDSDTAISSVVFEYGMDTLNNQAKRGMKGYVPVKKSRHQQAPGKDNLVNFLLHVLNKNHLKEQRMSFASRLANLTGVSGATLVHLLPELASKNQTMEEYQRMIRNEVEIENRRENVKERISEILSDENLPEQRKYLLEAIMDKLDGEAPKEAIETVNDLGEMILKRIDVVTNILQVLKEL